MSRNRIRCKACGEVIESRYRHDFQVCGCWKESGGERGVAVDGGLDYQRIVGRLESVEDVADDEGHRPR